MYINVFRTQLRRNHLQFPANGQLITLSDASTRATINNMQLGVTEDDNRRAASVAAMYCEL